MKSVLLKLVKQYLGRLMYDEQKIAEIGECHENRVWLLGVQESQGA